MKTRSSFLLLVAGATASAAVVAIACSDEKSDPAGSTEDASSSDVVTDRGSPAEDATTDAKITDAGDAGDVNAPPSVTGIWQGGQGTNYKTEWTVLVGLLAGAESATTGATVGVITYPSLGCGGVLTVLDPDGGVDPDAGFADDRDGGMSTVVKRLVLRETDSFNCVDGDNYFSLFSDGSLRLEWKSGAESYVGNLTRISTPGIAEPLVAVWGEPTIDGTGFRPILAATTRTDTVGQGSGVFLLKNNAGGGGCGGLWTLSQKTTASDLKFTESFPQGQVGCAFDGGASATLVGIDGGARYTRLNPVDAGDAGAFSIEKLSP